MNDLSLGGTCLPPGFSATPTGIDPKTKLEIFNCGVVLFARVCVESDVLAAGGANFIDGHSTSSRDAYDRTKLRATVLASIRRMSLLDLLSSTSRCRGSLDGIGGVAGQRWVNKPSARKY